MKDKQGREYLRLDQAFDGQKVALDGDFTCTDAEQVNLHKNEQGLFFRCKEGEHYLSGQADDGIHCVGIYPAK